MGSGTNIRPEVEMPTHPTSGFHLVFNCSTSVIDEMHPNTLQFFEKFNLLSQMTL